MHKCNFIIRGYDVAFSAVIGLKYFSMHFKHVYNRKPPENVDLHKLLCTHMHAHARINTYEYNNTNTHTQAFSITFTVALTEMFVW